MNNPNKTAYYALLLIFLASITALTLHIDRAESFALGIAYFSSFFSYFWLVKFSKDSKELIWVALLVHLVPLFGLPSLSDDVYRFIWDGLLIEAGIDPFAHVPEYYIEQNISVNGLTQTLFNKLNSPQYFTIYPPLNQLIFWLSAKFGMGSVLLSTNIIRVLVLIALFGALKYLKQIFIHHNLSPKLAYWFILNPLVIIELTGNVHFEAFVIFFLLLGIYHLHVQKRLIGGLAFGGAIAAKLLPLLFLPAILFNQKIKTGSFVVGVAMIAAIASFAPMLSIELFQNIQQSLGLYFQSFEFNASIYFLLREVGYYFTGYNIIGSLGPALSITTFLLIMALAMIGTKRKWKLEKTMLFSLTTYLLLATTVHPWYILTLIPLGLISGYFFPIYWSFTIFVSYFGYKTEGFELSSNWIVFEYGSLLIFFLIESYLRQNHEKIH